MVIGVDIDRPQLVEWIGFWMIGIVNDTAASVKIIVVSKERTWHSIKLE
jgi:hypothetical protein